MDYDKSYVSTYDDRRYGDIVGKMIAEIQLGILSEMINEDEMTILDVGAGTGWISIYLVKEKAAKIVMLDASSSMLKFAKSKAKSQNIIMAVIKGDVHNLPFRNASFDYVTSFRTMHHFKNPRVAISEMCRVSEQVILDYVSNMSVSGISEVFRSLQYFNDFVYRIKGNPEKSSKLFKLFSGRSSFFSFQIRKEFERNGFYTVKTDKYFVLPILLHRKLAHIFFSRKLEAILKKFRITSIFGSPIIVKAKRMDI
jgi:ubiquinone/menaquinone biosynthesis C-methylase UbiE